MAPEAIEESSDEKQNSDEDMDDEELERSELEGGSFDRDGGAAGQRRQLRRLPAGPKFS